MDAHDIFKKLTLGVKFIKPKQVKKNLIVNTVKLENEFPSKTSAEELNGGLQSQSLPEEQDEILFSYLASNDTQPKKKLPKQNWDSFSDEKKQKLRNESINHFRNKNNISVVGRHVPEPIASFSDLNISQHLQTNIVTCGYTIPTDVQKQAIPIILQERQLLACAPTGSGKTAAFLIPIINSLKSPKNSGIRALIITPTRELAKQIQRECEQLIQGHDLRVHFINKIKANTTQIPARLSSKIDILISTPKRLCYFLNQEPAGISLQHVHWLVIDEADKLFEMGVRGFREQLDKILEACSNEKRRIVMFSATHTPPVAFWCRHTMRGLITLTVGQRNAAAATLDQKLLFVGSESGKLIAIRDMVRKGLKPPVLIFVQSKERAQQLFSELLYDGLNVDVIHADRTQIQRDNTVRAFREGRIWVLICTELMARGVDFKGVHMVINYDFPTSAISYVHRVGRAGRAGRPGCAVTYFTNNDTINLRSIAQVLKQSGCEVPDYMLALKKRGKKQRKQLQISAPKREDISNSLKRKFNGKSSKQLGDSKKKKVMKPSGPEKGKTRKRKASESIPSKKNTSRKSTENIPTKKVKKNS